MWFRESERTLRGDLFRAAVIALSSLLLALNLKSFVRAGDLFPGGFSGIARLLQRCALEFAAVELPFAPIYLLLNAVPALISFRLVGYSVQEAGEMSGFSDNSHFIRTFGHLTGLTPGKYAKEYQSSDQVLLPENAKR